MFVAVEFVILFFFFKQKTAYEMRISDWSSDVCSSDLLEKHRTYGTGPAYRKVGGRVLYTLEDLRGWADRGACASTSDPNNGAVPPAARRPGMNPSEES